MKYLLGTDFVIPGRNEVTPNGRTDINIYNITVKGLSDKNTAIIVVYSPGTLVPEYPGLRCENRWDRRHTIIAIIIFVIIFIIIVIIIIIVAKIGGTLDIGGNVMTLPCWF